MNPKGSVKASVKGSVEGTVEGCVKGCLKRMRLALTIVLKNLFAFVCLSLLFFFSLTMLHFVFPA